jgi:hypothetical protein
MTLTANTTQVLLEYVMNPQAFPLPSRQFIAVLIKNIVKKAYGQHSYTHYEEQKRKEGESIAGDDNDPRRYIDQAGLNML